MVNSFYHLHTHSNYSLLDGTIPIRALVERAKQLKMTALALTDHNALYGAIEFYQVCQELKIKPIIGSQISLTDGSSLVLLVKNRAGYQNLCRIISEGHLKGGHLNFKCELENILPYKDNLVILSGGKTGLISQLVLSRNYEDSEAQCIWMKERFGENFYLEMQYFAPWDDFLNDRLQQIAHKCDVPLVATNDVHLLSPDDMSLRQVLHAIDQNTVRERVRTAGNKEQYFKSPSQMQTLFAKFPGAIESTQRIVDVCDLHFSLGKPVFPVMKTATSESGQDCLYKLCQKGAVERYKPVTPNVTTRINYELDVIHRLGFTDYFLIIKDIVDFCRRESIPCVGRGSAADSLVAYVLGITFADPIRFNLYFERFLNPERTDAPDIDLDLCWKNRDRVIEYVYKKYGADKTAMICTFSTFQSRAALREVAKTFGLPEDEIGDLTQYFPYMAKMATLDENVERVPELRHQTKRDKTYQEIMLICKQLAGFPRHLSIHSGGVIIAPDRITHFTPLEVAGKGIVISQYDMHSIERLGLVKMDLLGVRSLSIITDCLELARESLNQGRLVEGRRLMLEESDYPKGSLQDRSNIRDPESSIKFDFLKKTERLSALDMRTIPENDPDTIKLIKSGKTLGCFQLESPLVRGVLRKMQIDSVEDTVVAVAIIRPGVGDSTIKDEYILRRAGLRQTHYAHPILEPVLSETHGLTIYQEQVLLIAQAVAGFTLAEGDTLRRAMTKDRDEVLMNSLKEKFITGALNKGVPEAKAAEIWQYLRRFTGFGFNKAHAATYGILAYQTAFLKCYFPIEHMTAVLNNHGGFYGKAVYIEECRRIRLVNGQKGIPLLPPDINRSEIEFTTEGSAIRVGLYPIFELSDKTKQAIVEERKRRPFRDLYDFLQRTQARQKEAEHLIRCGALRSLHPSEPELLFKTISYFKAGGSKVQAEYLTKDLELPPYSKEQRILSELELLSFAIADHPLSLYDDLIPWENMVSSTKFEAYKDRRVQFSGWFVTSRLQETVTGKYMKFLSLEDKQGVCEIIFFPQVFEKYAGILHGLGPFTVTGKIQSRIKGEANLVAEKVIRWMSPREVVNSRLNGKQADLFGQKAFRQVA